MQVLLWIIRIYRWWMFGWVLLTWVPGIAGSQFHMLLGLPVYPVLRLFDFLNFGGIGFGAIIPLYGLYMLDRYLSNSLQAQHGAQAGQPVPYSPPPDALPGAADVDSPA